MASADPRKVGISKNCLEALVEFSTIAPSIEIDEHMCRIHKDEKECRNIKDFGRQMYQDSKDNIWKWCFIEPERSREEE